MRDSGALRAADPVRAQPGAAEDTQAGTTVFIRDLSVSTLIGVHEHERRRPRALLMDLDIELHASRAGQTDRLADTVDYAAVVVDVRRCLADKSYFLLERVAEFVADRILEEFDAKRVVVRVAKAGVLKDVGLVGVRIERCAAQAAAPAPSHFGGGRASAVSIHR